MNCTDHRIIPEKLRKLLFSQYALPLGGRHGISHMARVLETGIRLARQNGANMKVVSLFALFHDIKRRNESFDKGHGSRAADFAMEHKSDLGMLSGIELDLLTHACRHHTDGLTQGEITVRTCWDADRLDLGRVNIWPDPKYLCTSEAKDPETIRWANSRSKVRHVPSFVTDEWGFEPSLFCKKEVSNGKV